VNEKIRFKDRYWVKTLKWHLYKKRSGSLVWKCRYQFDKGVRSLTAGDIAIDCGANVGKFTRMLARNGARVHAFEPDPYSFARLQQNTAHLANVVCHNKAVGISHETVKLYRRPGFDDAPESASLSSSVFAEKINVSEDNFVEVEQIDFINFIEGLERPAKLIKIDIEGAEVPLLEEMIVAGTMDHVGLVFVETHETRIPALAERTQNLKTLASREYVGTLFLDWV